MTNKYLKQITYISIAIIFINTVLPFLIWLLLEITGVIFDNTFMSDKFIFNWFSILNIFLCILAVIKMNDFGAFIILSLNFIYDIYLIFEIVKMRKVITERFQAGLVIVLGISFISTVLYYFVVIVRLLNW